MQSESVWSILHVGSSSIDSAMIGCNGDVNNNDNQSKIEIEIDRLRAKLAMSKTLLCSTFTGLVIWL